MAISILIRRLIIREKLVYLHNGSIVSYTRAIFICTNRFMMKNMSKKKQSSAAATIGPTYHNMDG